MPWWFWVITHIWTASITALIVIGIRDEGHWNVTNWLEVVLLVTMHIFAPITLLVAFTMFLWENIITTNIHNRYAYNKLKKAIDYFKNRKQRKKDMIEFEEHEDEWRVERTGIKVK